MAEVPITNVHKLVITVQLTGNNAFVNQFDILATADAGDQYSASGSMMDDWRVLQQVVDEVKRCYPGVGHFNLRADGRRLVPRP